MRCNKEHNDVPQVLMTTFTAQQAKKVLLSQRAVQA